MALLNPVLLTQQSTAKLPRGLLLGMVAVYALSGLIGRDPWSGDDALGFGQALALSQNQGAVALQSVAGEALATEGPLWFAIVAAFIKALFFIPPHLAVKVPLVLAIWGTISALWYAIYYLARTPAAQPLALAVGGQPLPTDYGRAVADGGVLLILATLGVALRLHELSTELAQLLCLSALVLGASVAMYKPKLALYLSATALFCLGANRGVWISALACAWCAVLCTQPAWRSYRRGLPLLLLAAVAGVAAPFALAYALGQTAYVQALWAWNTHVIGWLGWARLNWLGSNIAFLMWPIMPFAAAALWRWRRYWRLPHIWLPATYSVVFSAGLLFNTDINDATTLTLVPGALILAAFLLPALPRAWMNAIDWFGVMALSFIAALIWFAWFAMSTGWPVPLSRNILRLAPLFDNGVNYLALGMGLAATAFWVFVVRWRVMAAKTVIWRAAVIWSAGSLMIWVLLTSLWMPWLNHTRTYRGVALELKAALKDHSQCVSPVRLDPPQRAVLAYFGEIIFEPKPLSELSSNAALGAEQAATHLDTPATVACNWLLEYDSLKRLSGAERPPYQPAGNWQLVWQGRRFTDKDERFRLYQRR